MRQPAALWPKLKEITCTQSAHRAGHDIKPDYLRHTKSPLHLVLHLGLFGQDKIVQSRGRLDDVTTPVVIELEASEVIRPLVDRTRLAE